jgi:hypothetical protein
MFSTRLFITGAIIAAVTAGTAAAYASTTSSSSPADRRGGIILVSSLRGRNEVPGTKGAVGDPDGRAVETLTVKGSTITFSVRWQGITAPTEGHIHAGAAGVNGDVRIELFDTPKSGDTASGSVKVKDRRLLAALTANPGAFYANLHTREFPGGALRGQLHRLSQPVRGRGPRVDVASVVTGKQIYGCTRQADGTFAFTQRDVDARLESGIRHSFVRPADGPPQWVAPDGSAVTGAVVAKTANGAGNIPELDLKATRTGTAQGRLAGVSEVLRLDTVGGIAPAGVCDPAQTPTAAVPYEADYLFVG